MNPLSLLFDVIEHGTHRERILWFVCIALLVAGLGVILRARRREREARSYQDLARRHAALKRDARHFQ